MGKKAVLLSFQVTNQKLISNGPGKSFWWDKVPSKFEGWKKKTLLMLFSELYLMQW